MVLKADGLRDVAGNPFVPRLPEHTRLPVASPLIGRLETGALISAASLLALITTAQSAVACEMGLSQFVRSFRIDACPFSIQSPSRQAISMPSPCLETRPARERMSKD